MKRIKRWASLLLAAAVLLVTLPATRLEANAKSGIKTQAEAVKWLNAQNNAKYDFNGKNGTQCVEFVKAYVNWVLTGNAWQDCWNRPTLNGNTIWKNSLWAELGWKVYYNTADFVPQPGDIFSAGVSAGNHTGVVISSDTKTAVIADANARDGDWSNGDPVLIHTINWKSASSDTAYGATHFIRPVFASTPAPSYTYSSITPGKYYLKNNATGTYLNVSGGTDANKQNIGLHAYDPGSLAEQFNITTTKDGYKMRPLCSSSRLVNAWGSSPSNGSNVNLYDDAGESSQWWKFEKVNGGYIVHNAYVPSCVLDADGSNVLIRTRTGGASQIWSLEPVAHTCRFDKFVYYWQAHPHYNCYECSICGKVQENRNEPNILDSCAECQRSLASPGDLDGNGQVTIQDVMEACKVLARQSAGKVPTSDELARGDLDGDEKFTITDVMEICKILARQA